MYSVKQAAELAGVSPDTVRYYDNCGLLVGVKRDPFGGRQFDDEAIEWLRLVVALRESGMSVTDLERFSLSEWEGQIAPSMRREALLRCLESLKRRADVLQGHIAVIDRFIGRDDG